MTIVYVMGYYRSGTSSLCGALNNMGIKFHNDNATNDKFNPNGYFEIPELIDMDMKLFKHLQSEWSYLKPLPNNWWNHISMNEFEKCIKNAIIDYFEGHNIFGLKHPHLCRLFPIYKKALSSHDCKIIHITRNPYIVAASHYTKNKLSKTHSLLLWLSYIINMEIMTRNELRTWITYNDLLENPIEQIKKISDDLSLSLDINIDFFDTQLNRSYPVPQYDIFKPLLNFVEEVWDTIQHNDFDEIKWSDFNIRLNEFISFLEDIEKSSYELSIPIIKRIPNISHGH